MGAYHRRYATGCTTAWANPSAARVWWLRRPTVPSPTRPVGQELVVSER